MTRTKNKKDILKHTENFIRELFDNEGSGHDWWHIYRVRNMALYLAEKEGGNKFIIEMVNQANIINQAGRLIN